MRRWLWVVLGVAVIAGATFGVTRWWAGRPKAEPRYDGKTAAEWVALLAEPDASRRRRPALAGRIRAARAARGAQESEPAGAPAGHRIARSPSGRPPSNRSSNSCRTPGRGSRSPWSASGRRRCPASRRRLRGPNGTAAARVLGLIGARATPAVPALVGLVQDGGADGATRIAAVYRPRPHRGRTRPGGVDARRTTPSSPRWSRRWRRKTSASRRRGRWPGSAGRRSRRYRTWLVC